MNDLLDLVTRADLVVKKLGTLSSNLEQLQALQSGRETLMEAKIRSFCRDLEAGTDLTHRSLILMFDTYAVASILYEVHNAPVISDHAFDRLCKAIADRWDEYSEITELPLMQSFDRSQFDAGTGMGVSERCAGTIIERIANRMVAR